MIALAACGPQPRDQASDSPSVTLSAYPTATPDISADEFPIYREPPVRIRAGRYENPSATLAVQQAANDMRADDADEPRFAGWIHGIYIAKYPDPESVKLHPCNKEDVRGLGKPSDEVFLRASPYWFDPPSYLPPGTFDWTYPSGSACGDEPAFGVYREFLIDAAAEISIGRGWDHFISGDYSKKRVQSGAIAGRPAVIIPPLTEEGAGDSHIFVEDPAGGVVEVNGFDISMSELEKIATALLNDIS